MGIQKAFYRWLLPAAFVLPLWLLIGFIVFNANAWGILWLLLIAMPSVFVGQLVFALMIRSRPWVARHRAVSWRDIAVMGTWHLLTVLVGLYNSWFWVFLILAIVGAIAVLVSCLAQLWQEASGLRVETSFGRARPSTHPFTNADPRGSARGSDDVFIVNERREQ